MKQLLLLLICLGSVSSSLAQNEQISVMDFVQIVKNNDEEALFYYENNWKVLRENALVKGYIESYQLLHTPASERAPFSIILITTFINKAQFDLKEQFFEELIQEKGPLKLMNELRPVNFRKTLFSKVATQRPQ